MPRLLIFVPCDRVIIDVKHKQASLIEVLEAIGVSLTENLPEDALAPLKWSIFTLWRSDKKEEGKVFEQRIEIVSPSGKVTGDHVTPFELQEGKLNHKVRFDVNGFRIGEAGDWIVRLSLREVDSGNKWQHLADYPINVKHEVPNAED
jgi:hypothetical protein